ncbi:MAG: 30S ribosome-binding factor RbfA [Hydrogenophilaceae bacterium]|nr:30S ribosome-binding factor RbfA [Hydrogenophilaceae bacterium]
MPADFPRARRVGEQIRQELANILWREMKDPRVTGVTITAVEVTHDLEHAKVYFSLLSGDPKAVSQALQRASGYLRTELSHRLRLRIVPRLNFQFDESLERGNRISHLIDQAVEEDKSHHRDDE